MDKHGMEYSIYRALLKRGFRYKIDNKQTTLYADFHDDLDHSWTRWRLDWDRDFFGLFMLYYCVAKDV